MRIAFLNVTGSLGGAERVLLTLLRELRRLRPHWQLTVVAGGNGPLIAAVEALGCSAVPLPLSAELADLGDWGSSSKPELLKRLVRSLPAVLRYRRELGSALRGEAPAIVHTNGFKMHILGALTRQPGSALFWHIHDFVSNRPAMRTLLRWFSGRPAAVIAISPAVAADLADVLRKPSVLHTIWNSVPLDQFTPAPSIPHPEIRIGMVGTFARWKGHKVFLQALSMLSPEVPWRGFIVGGSLYSRSGSQWTQGELEREAVRLGIHARIEFTGFLPDPAPFMQSLDIAVHASGEPEPFGLAIAECMATALAVVTTSRHLVADGFDGVVCEPGDAASLAGAIERLARDPALRCRLGQAAYQTAQQRFQPERMAREFIALYEGMRA